MPALSCSFFCLETKERTKEKFKAAFSTLLRLFGKRSELQLTTLRSVQTIAPLLVFRTGSA